MAKLCHDCALLVSGAQIRLVPEMNCHGMHVIMKVSNPQVDRRTFMRATLGSGARWTSAAAVLGSGAALAQGIPEAQQPPLSGYWRDRYLTIPGGTPAPSYGFYDAKGQWLTLQQYYGRPALIVFWATWCSACQIDMPLLNAAARQIDPNRLSVLPISIDDQPLQDVNGFMRAKGWTSLAHFQDQTQQLFNTFGSGATPTAFLMDRHGRILGGIRGAAYWDKPESQAVLDFMQSI